MSGTTFIYALCEPTGEVRYVGKANSPDRRYQQHCQRSEPNESKGNWISSLRETGKKPALRILAEVPLDECFAAERAWIARFMRDGAQLFNRQIGGGRDGATPSGFPSRYSVDLPDRSDDDVDAALARGVDGSRESLDGSTIGRMAMRYAMQKLDLSIPATGARLGLVPHTISRWLNGETPIVWEVLMDDHELFDLFFRQVVALKFEAPETA